MIAKAPNGALCAAIEPLARSRAVEGLVIARGIATRGTGSPGAFRVGFRGGCFEDVVEAVGGGLRPFSHEYSQHFQQTHGERMECATDGLSVAKTD